MFLSNAFDPDDSSCVFVCLHGQACSKETFSLVFLKLSPQQPAIAFDLSFHARISDAVADAIRQIFATGISASRPVILVGHSSGGALATRVYYTKKLNVVGLMLIDTVEGRAADPGAVERSLNFYSSRPKRFESMEAAVEWHLERNVYNNADGARVVLSALLNERREFKFDFEDLKLASRFWSEWFKNVSIDFYTAKLDIKSFLTSSPDHLDDDLIKGRFTGKFRLELFPHSKKSRKVGHFVCEDAPDEVAAVFEQTMARYRRSTQ